MLIEFTYNKTGSFSNSQVGFILNLPTQEILDQWLPFEVFVAPPGVQSLPVPETEITREFLHQFQWKPVLIGTAHEHVHYFYHGISAKRKQYGIRARLAMTLHRAMGSDFTKIATAVLAIKSKSGIDLWMKEQLEVLLSRTHTCKNLIFVGDSPQHTAELLASLLTIVSPFAHQMEHVVNSMITPQQKPSSILHPLKYFPYNLRQCIIPNDHNGYTYCIMSTATYSHTNIGTTHNLPKRLQQHNSTLGGAAATRNPALKPWVYIAFVSGFDDSKTSRTKFEKEWQQRRIKRGHYTLNPWQVLLIGMQMVQEWNKVNKTNLTFVQCIELKKNTTETPK
jgi:predicted GIY-YIG superfamily endonuclease